MVVSEARRITDVSSAQVWLLGDLSLRQQRVCGGIHDHVVGYVVDYRGLRADALDVGPDPVRSMIVILHILDCGRKRHGGAMTGRRVMIRF